MTNELEDLIERARKVEMTPDQADAAELRLRAERRLGILIGSEKQAGRIRTGPERSISAQSEPIVRVRNARECPGASHGDTDS